MSEEGLRKEIMKDLIREVYGPRNFNEDSTVEDIVHEKMSENPLNEYLAGVIIQAVIH